MLEIQNTPKPARPNSKISRLFLDSAGIDQIPEIGSVEEQTSRRLRDPTQEVRTSATRNNEGLPPMEESKQMPMIASL